MNSPLARCHSAVVWPIVLTFYTAALAFYFALSYPISRITSYREQKWQSSALDPELVGEVLDTMRLLAEEGMTMIAVTHEIGFAREVSDRVAYVHEGRIEEIGPPSQVISAPGSSPRKRGPRDLANCPWVPACAGTSGNEVEGKEYNDA